MKRIAFLIVALVSAFALSHAHAAALSKNSDPFHAYYGNTYTCYWPGMWECHHWWNADGNEIFFDVQWLQEGILILKTIDGPHESWIANGQWCSWNARTAVGKVNGAVSRGQAQDDPFVFDKADPKILNNNRNGCQPIVDAQPGDHWFKLHLNGNEQDQREQYTLMPGHQ